MKKNTLLAFAIFILATVPMAGAAAANVDSEIATATTHAQMAGDAADVATAVMHFHHVINCLVGPKNKLFDASVGNPCDGMGNGALNDVGKKSAEHAQLNHALAIAEEGLHAKKLATTQQYAMRISKALKGVGSGE